MLDDEPLPEVQWDIRREGRAWSREEWNARREHTPEKFELSRGMLFWRDEDRLAVLALMIENLGVDRVVRLGDPKVWREAIAALDEPKV
jgi:hypothetical protein